MSLYLPCLQDLCLAGCDGLSAAALAHPLLRAAAPRLTALDLSYLEAADAALLQLLTTTTAAAAAVTTAAAAAAASAAPAAAASASAALPPPLLGCLRSLALAQCTTLGDETLAALAAHAPALTALNLSGCLRLSDDAVGLMLSRLPRLTSVDLSYLCVSDAGGVRALCGLRALTSVNLEGCPLCTEVAKPKPKPKPNPDPDPNPNPNQVGLAQLTRALPALELANFSGW